VTFSDAGSTPAASTILLLNFYEGITK